MRALETYLFDLDGTLLDSVELILACYRHAVRTHLGLELDDEVCRRGLGTPLEAQFRAFTREPAQIATLIATYREHNRRHHDGLARPYPGAIETVRELRRRRARLGIVTSKGRAGVASALALMGLEQHFEVLVCAEDTGRHKPDPTPVRHALEQLGAAPDTAVFVGDSPHDLASGRAAGVRTAAAQWGPFTREELAVHAPDYWLDTPRCVLGLDAGYSGRV
jgi:pyrophosphatase PpaX